MTTQPDFAAALSDMEYSLKSEHASQHSFFLRQYAPIIRAALKSRISCEGFVDEEGLKEVVKFELENIGGVLEYRVNHLIAAIRGHQMLAAHRAATQNEGEVK